MPRRRPTARRRSPFFSPEKSFFKAAQQLEVAVEERTLRLRFEMPIYYLYSHALELVLKSFLRAKGLCADELKKIRAQSHPPS